MAKSCLTKKDIALSETAVKKNKPVSESKQKLIEKQEKMFYALNKDAMFQKSLVGLTKTETTNAYWKKIKANGINITRKKTKQMVKNGITIAKQQPIVIPKPLLGAKPSSVMIPKPPPKIVSIPKEPVPKAVPIKPIPKELLTEFREAKTLEEALEEYKKYGHGNPMTSKFANVWDEKKKLETMNRINVQMNSMEKWIRGRKLGELNFFDGDQKTGAHMGANLKMSRTFIGVNYRREFRKFGVGEEGVGSLQRWRMTVSGGNSSVALRHEMGHVLYYDDRSIAGSKLRSEFVKKYIGTNRAIVERNISTYANTNAREFFAETFAIYSSPKYKMGTLNKVFGGGFEELMEKILISNRKPLQIAKAISKTVPKVVFKEAKTMDEAMKEWKKYGKGGLPVDKIWTPLYGKDVTGWDKKYKLQAMNEINRQMDGMQKWLGGRKIDYLRIIEGDKDFAGMAIMDQVFLNAKHVDFKSSITIEKLIASLKNKAYTVGGSNAGIVLRHEIGHLLYLDTKGNYRWINRFEKLFDGLSKKVIEENVSRYAATNVKEFFAESFAIYSSPEYKMGTFFKVFGEEFEDLMENILTGGI